MRTRIFLQPEHRGDFFRRARRSEPAGGDVGFDLWQCGFERAVGAQRREQPLLEHGPQPFDLLFAAARGKFAGARQPLAMIEDFRP